MNLEANPEPTPRRTKLPHDTPNWVSAGAVFFITISCADRVTNQLCTTPTARALFESVEFRIQRHDWWVDLFLLMPDHLHALISFPPDGNMRKIIANWKEVAAKKTGVHWQRDFFDHRLRDAKSYDEKAVYIRLNPVRKGLVARPADWTFVWEPTGGGPSGPALP